MSRDEFSRQIRIKLAERVNYHCSNPECMKQTAGPNTDPSRSTVIGKAAHITAAAPGGPRYDPMITPEHRKSAENGIWLCADCADRVDRDPEAYPTELLLSWKANAEKQAAEAIGRPRASPSPGQALSAVNTFLVISLEELTSRISADTERALTVARQASLEGRPGEARKWVAETRSDRARWESLTPELRGRIIRFEAGLVLSCENDAGLAEKLAEQARLLSPQSDDSRLRALLVYRQAGARPALDMLAVHEDIDSVNLRAALLLELGRLGEFDALLGSDQVRPKWNAESYRLAAFAHLARGEVSQGRLAAQRALELEPGWRSTRQAVGMMYFYSAVSPAALPGRAVSWPEPVPRTYIKEDDESMAALQRAGTAFQQLLQSAEITKEDREDLQCWYLATLACSPEHEADAISYCRMVLEKNPADHRAISWAVMRRFDIDLQPSAKALREVLASPGATVNDCVALVVCLLELEGPRSALRLLRSRRDLFLSEKQEALWLFWCSQTILAAGRVGAALRLLEGSGGQAELAGARTAVLRARAQETGDTAPLVSHLEFLSTTLNDSSALFEACAVMGHHGHWDYVATRAEKLVAAVGTGHALRLAANGLWRMAQLEKCLSLLNQHQTAFPGNRLPADLQAVRIDCQSRLGLVSEALTAAEALVHAEPTVTNMLGLARLYLGKGDLAGVARLAHALVESDDLAAADGLWLAGIVRFENPDLAKRLWRAAIQKDLDDSGVVSAYLVAFWLGLEYDARPLHQRMTQMASKRPDLVRSVSLDGIHQQASVWHDSLDKARDAYQKGLVPIHIVAGTLWGSLAVPYHVCATSRASAPEFLGFPVYVRHGGRAALRELSEFPLGARLHLDLTAFLTAAQIDLLDVVNSRFARIYMPRELPAALIRMREAATPAQPSRLGALREIVRLRREGKLRIAEPCAASIDMIEPLRKYSDPVWISLLEAALSSGGVVADYLPLRDLDLRAIPEDVVAPVSKALTNCRTLVEALRNQGPLSESAYEEAVDLLGEEGKRTPMPLIPTFGGNLFLAGQIPEALATAQVLGLVCEHFNVFIHQEEAEAAEHALRRHEQSREATEWIDALLERVTHAIDSGTYQLLPAFVATSFPRVSGNEAAANRPEVLCLASLLSYSSSEPTLVWTDDRYLSAFDHCNGAPIVTTCGVLEALFRDGTLDESDYFRRLLSLRTANMRFLPLDKDELLFHLAGALEDQGALIETKELTTIRQYFAGCLANASTLQKREQSGNPGRGTGELEFLVTSLHAVRDTILATWKDQQLSLSRRQTVADWLAGRLLVRYLREAPLAAAGDSELYGLTLAGMLAQALNLDSAKNSKGESQRRQYIDWLNENILVPAFVAEPSLQVVVASFLRNLFLVPPVSAPTNDVERAVAAKVLHDLIQDFPAGIREELWQDAQFAKRLGVEVFEILQAGGLQFRSKAFMAAAEQAVAGRPATVSTLSGDSVTITVERIPKRSPILVVSGAGLSKPLRLVDDLNGLLLPKAAQREGFLRRHRQWFDCPAQDFDRSVADIAMTEDAETRLRQARAWRETCSALYYRRLQEDLAGHGRMSMGAFMPPSVSALLRHLRLPTPDSGQMVFSEALDRAAAALVQEEGLPESIRRLGGLPLPLPAPITRAFDALPLRSQQRVLRDVFGQGVSPVARIHEIALCARPAKQTTSLSKRSAAALNFLVSDAGLEQAQSFITLLTWVGRRLSRLPETASMPAAVKLSLTWAHAHRLSCVFDAVGAPSSAIVQNFDRTAGEVPLEVFHRERAMWNDIVHPRHLKAIPLLAYGIGYALGNGGTHRLLKKGLLSLRGRCFPGNGGIESPDGSLLFDNQLCSNALDSFMGWDTEELMASLFGSQSANAAATASRRAVVDAALQALARDPDQVENWLLLYQVLGDREPYPSAKAEITDRIEHAVLPMACVGDSPQRVLIPLLCIASQAAACESPAARANALSLVVEAAREIGSHPKPNSGVAKGDEVMPQENWPFLLLDACLAMSVRVDEPESTARHFAESVEQVVSAAPNLARPAHMLMQILCDSLPISLSKHLWPALIRLRAVV